MLIDEKWDCAEAIELNKWTFKIANRYGKLPEGAFKKPGSSILQSLLAVNKLRHASVHRLRTSAKGIIQMIEAAVQFAETLSDTIRASQLGELLEELRSKVKSQELNKNYLEAKLKDELEEVERQRAELTKREALAISAMVTEDEDNMHFIGSLLEGKFRNILDGVLPDGQLDNSDSAHQADDDEIGGIGESPRQKDSGEEPDSPRQGTNGSESVEMDHEDTPADTAEESPMVEGVSSMLPETKVPFLKDVPPIRNMIGGAQTSGAAKGFEIQRGLVETSPSEEAALAERVAANSIREAILTDAELWFAWTEEQRAGKEARTRELAA